ncbi:hypothetical protein TNCV_511941 [Trichonephila clavipes]|nr:hypothetical protein TNCV_511941 [Trichonephila clavipes]
MIHLKRQFGDNQLARLCPYEPIADAAVDDRNSRVLTRGHDCPRTKVTYSYLTRYEFEPSDAGDTPCRVDGCTFNLSRLQGAPVDVV